MKKTLKEATQLFVQSASVLVPFFIVWSWLEALLTRFIQEQIGSHEGAPVWIWAFVVLSVLLSLVGPLFVTFWMLRKDRNLAVFVQALAEQIRSMGSVLLWTLALLLPGLIRFLQLSFVSFVSLLDEKYQAGEVHALKASREIFQRCWWQTCLVVLIFAMIFPLAFTIFDEWLTLDGWIYSSPLFACLLLTVELYVAMLGILILKSLWEKNRRTA